MSQVREARRLVIPDYSERELDSRTNGSLGHSPF